MSGVLLRCYGVLLGAFCWWCGGGGVPLGPACMLAGLSDASEAIAQRLFDFWNHPARIEKSLGDRFVSVLKHMFTPKNEVMRDVCFVFLAPPRTVSSFEKMQIKPSNIFPKKAHTKVSGGLFWNANTILKKQRRHTRELVWNQVYFAFRMDRRDLSMN